MLSIAARKGGTGLSANISPVQVLMWVSNGGYISDQREGGTYFWASKKNWVTAGALLSIEGRTLPIPFGSIVFHVLLVELSVFIFLFVSKSGVFRVRHRETEPLLLPPLC